MVLNTLQKADGEYKFQSILYLLKGKGFRF